MSDETTTEMLAEIEEQAAEPEPQPVQVREGRWRTRGGEIRHVTPTPEARNRINQSRYSWYDAHYNQTWLPSGQYTPGGESRFDLVEYLGPIESEPDRIMTPDEVAAEALAGVNEWPSVQILRRKLETTEAALLEQQQRNERLVTQGSQQHMEIYELQRELSESQRLVVQQQNRIQDLLISNETTEPQPVHLQAMVDSQAETIARLHSEIHGLSIQNAELLAQREAVKDELVRQCENSRLLQIELDAREQVPQAVSDRFEEGWDAGTARAVETIAEWTEPFRTCGSQALALAVLQNLPHIMRTLTGLTDED